MAKIDLKKMSVKELKALERDVAKALAADDRKRRKEALAAVRDTAKKWGYTLAELMGTRSAGPSKPAKAPRAPAPAKYRHPEDPTVTWTGKGRKPGWFVDALTAGKTPEDLEIGKS